MWWCSCMNKAHAAGKCCPPEASLEQEVYVNLQYTCTVHTFCLDPWRWIEPGKGIWIQLSHCPWTWPLPCPVNPPPCPCCHPVPPTPSLAHPPLVSLPSPTPTYQGQWMYRGHWCAELTSWCVQQLPVVSGISPCVSARKWIVPQECLFWDAVTRMGF